MFIASVSNNWISKVECLSSSFIRDPVLSQELRAQRIPRRHLSTAFQSIDCRCEDQAIWLTLCCAHIICNAKHCFPLQGICASTSKLSKDHFVHSKGLPFHCFTQFDGNLPTPFFTASRNTNAKADHIWVADRRNFAKQKTQRSFPQASLNKGFDGLKIENSQGWILGGAKVFLHAVLASRMTETWRRRKQGQGAD